MLPESSLLANPRLLRVVRLPQLAGRLPVSLLFCR